MKRRLILFIPLIFLFCAKEGMPPGGPEDKTPPKILRTIPAVDATRVDTNTSVEIWFSESVQPGAAKDAVFITPYPRGEVRLKWRRKRLIIRLPEVLQPDRTYVITLGTGIRDYRNNALEKSFILAFSTGDSLNTGQISGRVFLDERASGIDVWAYPIRDGLDPDPRRTSPDYIVQCSENGEFKFTHMALCPYRLFAVQDRLADRLYQPVQDRIGVSSRDVDLTAKNNLHTGPVCFRMTQEDTLAPRLVRAVSVQNNLVSLQFNEPIEFDQKGLRVQIKSSESLISESNLPVLSHYQDPKQQQWLHLITEPQSDGYHYQVSINGIHDLAGHEIDSSFQITAFTGIGFADMVGPALLDIFPKNKEKNIDLLPSIECIFSEAMDTTDWASHARLLDKNDSQITMFAETLDGMHWLLRPAELLESKSAYRFILDSLLTDLSGNALKDTVVKFITLNPDTLSDISGEILDTDSSVTAPIILILQKTGKDHSIQQIAVPRPGSYQFDHVFPGLYTIWGFEDLDGDGSYSYGRTYPYMPAEPFFVSSDTLKTRSRWSNTGNDFSLP